MISVQVKEIAFDLSMSPVVLLIDDAEERVLPIWIGPFEAQAIAMALQGVVAPRPMTHDLLKSICDYLGVSVRRALINDFREGNYCAELYLQTLSGELTVDSRPSDAIALALKAGAPLYISEKVAGHTLAVADLISDEQQEDMRRLLGLTTPEEYKKSLH